MFRIAEQPFRHPQRGATPDPGILPHTIELGATLSRKISSGPFLKVIARDRIGSFITAEACEAYLQNWLLSYCSADESASADIKARYPLREAKVEVREIPSKPGSYHCTAHLQPHAQLDQVVSAIKFVTELAPSR